MTEMEIRDAITSALDTVDFEELTVQYCVQVKNRLHSLLPVDASVDVCFRRLDLLVEVRLDGKTVLVVTSVPPPG